MAILYVEQRAIPEDFQIVFRVGSDVKEMLCQEENY
jgi:hypothetical protein